jgi:periplasmic protein TonB
METKKNPSADLRQKRGSFLNFGLCISLALVLFAFEWKTEEPEKKLFDVSDLIFGEEDIPEVPLTYQTPPPPKIINPIIEIIPDDIDIPDSDVIIDMGTEVTPDIVLEGPPVVEPADVLLDFSEVMPQPVGGMESWNSYLSKNMKYPTQARRMGVEGTVYVSFVVNKYGNIEDVEVIRGIGAGCDEEAIRVIQEAENWIPGRNGGLPVKVKMRVPIRFRLQ